MGSGYDQYNGWQIMGEIQGALRACTEARKIGVEELEIRYDYEGIRCWADGEWRCKKPYTIQYARDIKEFRKYMKIKFVHVKAHTGISGNESADNLAKTACEINPGVKIPDTTPGYVPEIPESCNKGCREAIISFYQKKAHTFKDYIAVNYSDTSNRASCFNHSGYCHIPAQAGQFSRYVHKRLGSGSPCPTMQRGYADLRIRRPSCRILTAALWSRSIWFPQPQSMVRTFRSFISVWTAPQAQQTWLEGNHRPTRTKCFPRSSSL